MYLISTLKEQQRLQDKINEGMCTDLLISPEKNKEIVVVGRSMEFPGDMLTNVRFLVIFLFFVSLFYTFNFIN